MFDIKRKQQAIQCGFGGNICLEVVKDNYNTDNHNLIYILPVQQPYVCNIRDRWLRRLAKNNNINK